MNERAHTVHTERHQTLNTHEHAITLYIPFGHQRAAAVADDSQTKYIHFTLHTIYEIPINF